MSSSGSFGALIGKKSSVRESWNVGLFNCTIRTIRRNCEGTSQKLSERRVRDFILGSAPKLV